MLIFLNTKPGLATAPDGDQPVNDYPYHNFSKRSPDQISNLKNPELRMTPRGGGNHRVSAS